MKRLSGRVIINTQATANCRNLSELLIKEGATVYCLPMIETLTLPLSPEINNTLADLNKFDWLVFTSKKGVSAFFEQITEYQKNTALPPQLKIAVIGNKTATELERYGYKSDFTNPGNTSDEFLIHLENNIIKKAENVLLALGNLAPDKLQNSLKQRANIKRINVYKTIAPQDTDNKILNIVLNKRFDLLIFTSPSAFQNFILITGFTPDKDKLPIASIGKITTNAIKKTGFDVMITAKQATIEGLADEINNYEW